MSCWTAVLHAGSERQLSKSLFGRLIALAQAYRPLQQDFIFHDLALVQHDLRDLGPGELLFNPQDQERLVVRGKTLPQLRISPTAIGVFLAIWGAWAVLRNLPWAPFTWFFV